MTCMRCGKEMTNTSGGNFTCPHCRFAVNDLVNREYYKPSITEPITDPLTPYIGDPLPYTPQFTPLEEPNKSNGMVGWICPVCGKGLSPWTSECSCRGSKLEITCNATNNITN